MTFVFKKGISNKHIQQLIKYSNDKNDLAVYNFTSDKIRFANKKSFEEWFKKDRVVYTVTDEKNLIGIIWFGQKNITIENHSFETTFAIRLYPKARGQGLSFNFMDYAFRNYQPKNIWLECSANNAAAFKLYTKFGFHPITSPDKNNKIIMVLDKKND
jgi:ribosomal protein S18 acetylase RimI-like enzyme